MKSMHFFLMSALIPALTQAMDNKKEEHCKLIEYNQNKSTRPIKLNTQGIEGTHPHQSPRKKESPRDKITSRLSSKPSIV